MPRMPWTCASRPARCEWPVGLDDLDRAESRGMIPPIPQDAMMIGKTLGPYQVLDKLGQGGMGEVYRAKDPRLDRLVAIKVLPATLAGDAEFRERFEREARTISQLSHPNICTLYDVGNQDGVSFLVMEYLEGE